ncbi:MAG TPA: hypothetical protein VHF22_00730, partial [Planctomycetota bacterium]|nr:hypothetical protein [Planctomycetota bacterium]
MQGRERKIVRAALRACQDALAEIEPVATGDRPASALAIARAIRTLLEGQVAILEALGGPALAREAADEPELASHPMPHYASTLPEAERGRKPAPKPAPEAGFAPEPPAPAAPAA